VKDSLHEERKGLIKSASAMGFMTLLSRIFGLIRDIATALFLGTGAGADAFWIAYTIPNLLRRLVGEGTMTAAFVPVFTEFRHKNSEKAVWQLANKCFYTLALLLIIISILGIIFSSYIVTVIAPGFTKTPGKIELTTKLTRLMFFYIAFIGLAALAMAILNSFNSFAPSAFTPVLLNISIIVCAFLLSRKFPYPSYAFAIGVLIGGFLQLGFQIPFLIKKGMNFIPGISFSHPAIRQIARLSIPGFFSIGIVQINVAISRIFASWLEEGAVSSLTYSNRIMELTLGVFAISISTVILPLMSRQVITQGIEAMKRTLSYAIRLIAYITIPATIGLIMLRTPIIRALLQWGRFDMHSVKMTTFPLIFYSLGLFAVAGSRIVAPSFYSLKDTKTPVKVAAVAMVANIIFCFILIYPLKHGGIALALSLSSYLNLYLLLHLFQKRNGTLKWKKIIISLVKIIVASIVMGVSVWVIGHAFQLANQTAKLKLILYLLLTILASIAIYVIITVLLKNDEIRELLAILQKKESTILKS
jgi:putative peptidoglycan lipid II flippase